LRKGELRNWPYSEGGGPPSERRFSNDTYMPTGREKSQKRGEKKATCEVSRRSKFHTTLLIVEQIKCYYNLGGRKLQYTLRIRGEEGVNTKEKLEKRIFYQRMHLFAPRNKQYFSRKEWEKKLLQKEKGQGI